MERERERVFDLSPGGSWSWHAARKPHGTHTHTHTHTQSEQTHTHIQVSLACSRALLIISAGRIKDVEPPPPSSILHPSPICLFTSPSVRPFISQSSHSSIRQIDRQIDKTAADDISKETRSQQNVPESELVVFVYWLYQASLGRWFKSGSKE